MAPQCRAAIVVTSVLAASALRRVDDVPPTSEQIRNLTDNFLGLPFDTAVPAKWWDVRSEWTSKFILKVLTGESSKKDDIMRGCCEMVNKTGLRPHETWGKATKSQINWWVETGCNNHVGASVLAVGAPNCDSWNFLKTGYVSERVSHFDISNKAEPTDLTKEYLRGCSAEDRQKINATINKDKPVLKMMSTPECSDMPGFTKNGKLNRTLIDRCISKFFGGLSPTCPFCFSRTLALMSTTGDVVTHEPCMSMCHGLDKCWGMEKCVRMAGNCTRCFERHILNADFCVGGPTRVQLNGPSILTSMMGFWSHVR